MFSIGGYEEVGRNMSAIKVDDEIVILDMGWDLSKVLLMPPNIDWRAMSTRDLINLDVFPNDEILLRYRKNVKAIVCSHAHLDHISAIPKMAPGYPKAPVYGTPFTIEILKDLIKDNNERMPNKLIAVQPGETVEISRTIQIEFIYTTHSTMQCSMIAVHTPYGVVVYANDWKFDENPVLGPKTDYKRLRQLGKKGDVIGLISCCLNVEKEQRTYSENICTAMLNDVLLGINNTENGIICTTFASKIDRIKVIIDIAKKMGRTPVIFGSSMDKYINAAEKCKLVKITDQAEIYSKASSVKKKMAEIEKRGRSKYLLITTGHQGEPGSILDRISRKELPYKIKEGDQIIFSSSIIPSPINFSNRAEIETRLKRFQPRIFKDVHVSGHASKEEHRDLMKMLKPHNYIPCHGDVQKLSQAISLAYDFNMRLGKDAHVLQNGQRLSLD